MKNEIEILQQKLAESEKREQELRLQAEELTDFIENASLPLHWVNGSGIIIWTNQAELDMLGYTKEEYISKHISNFHADKEVIEDILARLINKETLRNYPARLKCKNGAIKHVLINSNVLWDGDRFIHTRCFTRDITELRNEEERKTALITLLQEQNGRLLQEKELFRRKVED